MLTDFCKPTLGGIEQHVFSLTTKLIQNGHNVIIGTVKQEGLKKYELLDGVSVYRLDALFLKIPLIYSNPKKKYHPPFEDVLLVRELENLVNMFNPDVIHCHGWIVFSYLALKSKFKIPLTVTLHHYGFVCPKQDLFFKNETVCNKPFSFDCYSCSTKNYGFLASKLLSILVLFNKNHFSEIDQFIAVSNFVKLVHVQHLGLSNKTISTISNFCEIESEPKPNYRDLPSEFILYVGQLVPYKGIDFLLDAYLVSKLDLPLVLIGGKHQENDYKRFHDGKKIFVYENAPRELVLAALKQCSFLVVPSIWADPCPTTVLEAMAFEKAVIGSKYGGIPEMVEHDKTGFILEPKNIQEFVTRLKFLSNDQKLQKTMGAAGKKRFQDYFDSGKIVTDIENIYDGVMKK